MTLAGHFLDDLARAERRNQACALALYAVNGDAGRNVGDLIHEQVTEGRRRQWEDARKAGAAWALAMKAGYHSCGDLVAWMLTRLGCRDEALVNRTDDGGIRAWQPGRNVTNITGSRFYRRLRVCFRSLGILLRSGLLFVSLRGGLTGTGTLSQENSLAENFTFAKPSVG